MKHLGPIRLTEEQRTEVTEEMKRRGVAAVSRDLEIPRERLLAAVLGVGHASSEIDLALRLTYRAEASAA